MTTQTKTAYTPGPWKVLHHTAPQHDGDRAVYGPGNKLICDMNGGPNDDSETLANARLIAMAPELLGVAKTFSQFLGVIGHREKMKLGVDTVISKAEGRGA